jgi:hypothetical protein
MEWNLVSALTLREEHRLWVFENKVLRRISGLMRDQVTGGWRNQHNEELHDLYSMPNIIKIMKSKRMKWARRRMYISYWYDGCHVDRIRWCGLDWSGSA